MPKSPGLNLRALKAVLDSVSSFFALRDTASPFSYRPFSPAPDIGKSNTQKLQQN